jgi:hypothetical protein
VSDECRVLERVGLEKGGHVGGKGSVVVGAIVGRVAVVAEVDCVDGTGEGAGEGAGWTWSACRLSYGLRGEDVLAYTPIVLLAAKEAMEDHDRVAFRFALVIVEAVGQIDDAAARRRVKGARPLGL